MMEENAIQFWLNVLSLEDSDLDFEIISEHLFKTGNNFKITRAVEEKEFTLFIQNQSYDIILADYQLPQFDAFEALMLCNKYCPDIPFICVSGSIGEIKAIELLKMGAVDYVMKDRMERLPFAVKRALDEAKEKKALKLAEEQLKKKEENFRTLTENIPDIIARFDKDLRYLYVNPAIEKITGILSDSFIGKTNEELGMPEEKIALWNKNMRYAFQTGEQLTFEFEFQTQATTFYFSSMLVPEFGEDGKVSTILSVIRDISENKKAEIALRKSEERYRLISDVASDYIFTSEVDKNGKLGLNWVTGAFERITGYSFEEYIAQGGWRATLHPDDIEKDNHDFEELKKNNKVITDVRTIAKNGRIVWVRVYAHPVWDHHNNILVGIYGGVKDITESKLADNALSNSETRLRTLVQTIPDLIWLKDINGVYLSCNAVFERLYNAKEADIIGKTDYDFVDRELADSFRENDLKAIALGKPSINEEWVTFADDGHTALLETTKTPMYSSSGELLGVLGIGHDITKRKQFEVALKESNERLNLILENNPIAIWDWDIKADKWFATQNYYTMLGYESESNYPDRTVWLNRVHPDDREYVRNKISNILNYTDKHYSYEARMLHADGSYRWQTVLGKAIDLDKDGNVSHMIGVRIDTNDRKQAEQELINAKERAEESDRLKTAFLSNMSHEIRTPLNSIIGFSDLLLDPSFEPEQQIQFVNAIKQSGYNLTAIISDIIDISRIETNQITIRKDQLSVAKLITDICIEQSYLIEGKGLELKINKSDQDILIIGDEGRIQQILLNFITNAIKFTEKGFIEIGYSFRLNSVHLYVKDSGIGILEEFHEKIFERFRQIETAQTRKYGGNGLGLAISKQLAELMGGKVSVESEPGKGSTFYFSLPLI